jgi:hypothetical protein
LGGRSIAQEAIDGLFYMIGQEEKALRSNPLGVRSNILKKVFGMLKYHYLDRV